MAKGTKAPSKRSGTFVLGRHSFSKISAVEGIKPSRERDKDFQEFDRRGLSAGERRRALADKYGK